NLARRDGDIDRACEALAELERQSGLIDLAVIRAAWLAEAGRVDQAHAALDAMPEPPRAGTRATYARAMFLAREGKLREARRQLERFLELSGDYFEIYVTLGDMLVRQGDLEAARTLGERLQRMDPHEELGRVLVAAAQAGQKAAA